MLELGNIIGILLEFLRSDIAGNAPPGQFVTKEERMQPGEDCGLAKRKQLLLIDGTGQLQAETRRRLLGKPRQAGHRFVGQFKG